MAKDPAFLFYSADFMMGTMLLTMEEKGQYITLLSIMHQQGRLTLDEVEVVIKGKPSTKLAAKFKTDDEGRWYNERLEAETEKRKNFTESRRNSLNIDNNDPVHIYLLHDPISGNIKIGSSKYPLMRLGEMQKKNPAIVMVWKSENLVIRSVEKELHIEFRDKKIKNDWFALSEDDLTSIINKEQFRTNTINNSRTEYRTVNENRDVNENISKEVKLKVAPRETAQLVPLPFNSDAFTFAWNEWNDYRVERKKKLTASTTKKQLAKLAKYPEQIAIEMINQSIEKGWEGLFEVVDQQIKKNGHTKNDRTQQTISDLIGLEQHISGGGYSGN